MSRLLLPTLALAAMTPAAPDEGQWLPEQIQKLPLKELAARGLQLPAEALWDGQGGGLLTAAVQIGGCSASFVSAEGLVLTNHHCVFDAVQLVSTPEKNYVRDGFVAPDRAAEIPAPGVRLQIVRKIEDVTATVRAAADAAKDDAARQLAVQRRIKELIAEGEKLPATRCSVASFYEGREFRLYHRTELRDVRLCYVPPRAVGEFGGEDDNWMWPRHTGDFSFVRCYVGKDGQPADHHKDNVPFRPKQFLKVAHEGPKENDLLLIMGYPGRTERYLTSVALEDRIQKLFPLRKSVYGRVIALLESESAGEPARALKFAATVKSLANRDKNAAGMIWGLNANRTLDRKRAQEQAFAEWIAADPARKSRHGAVLAEMQALDQEERAVVELEFLAGELTRLPDLLGAALTLVRWHGERGKADLDRDAGFQDRDLSRLKSAQKNLQTNLDLEAEPKVLALLGREVARLPAGTLPPGFARLASMDVAALRPLYGQTRLTDLALRTSLLEGKTEEFAALSDPLLDLARAIEADLARIRDAQRRRVGRRLVVGPRWVSALQEWLGGAFYPDANGTLRVSVASVRGYAPRDGVLHTPFTTLSGLLAKETGKEPFASPAGLLAAAAAAEPAARVCFLMDGDTTGGNSGSPVVNGRGELVGINFDRVFENVAGDYGYSTERSRNIAVDFRYIRWQLEKVMPAPALVAELGLPGK